MTSNKDNDFGKITGVEIPITFRVNKKDAKKLLEELNKNTILKDSEGNVIAKIKFVEKKK